MQDTLDKITETINGHEVKNLTWLERDKVIRGQVKCPVTGRDSLHNGFVVVTWWRSGSLTLKYGGNTRKDLYLNIDNPSSK